jgi:hypothetical protein
MHFVHLTFIGFDEVLLVICNRAHKMLVNLIRGCIQKFELSVNFCYFAAFIAANKKVSSLVVVCGSYENVFIVRSCLWFLLQFLHLNYES